MARFSYFARDNAGKSIQAIAEAPSLQHLVSTLKKKNLVVISAREIKEKVRREKKKTVSIKLTHISFFFRQLATMLSADIPLVDSLKDLSTQSESISLSKVINEVRANIEKGSTLSQSLAKYPRLFSPLIIATVKAGEEGGKLQNAFEQISAYLQDKLALQREVRSATAYPAVIAGFFVIALAFITFFLIPKFETIFSEFGVALPFLTKMIISTSHFLFKNFPYLLFILFLLVSGAVRYNHTKSGRRFFDTMKIRLPLIGPIFQMSSLSYFCQTFSILIISGISMLKCLEIVGGVSGSILIEEATERIRLGVIGGSDVSSEMRRFSIFPLLIVRMLAVGEKTGKMGEMLTRVSEFYRRELTARVRVLTSVLEPVMLIGLALVVGIVVIALYLPIFKMSGAMGA